MISNFDSHIPIGEKMAYFNIGGRVRTTSELNIRTGPGTNYPIIRSTDKGDTGRVVEGPITGVDNYTWLKIKYDFGVTGWSAENWLIPL